MAHTEKDRREKRIPVKNIVKRTIKCTVKGSTVIEMSYIIPLFLGMFALIMHAVFYYHDKAVLNGAASETAILAVQAERRADTEYDLEGFFRERMNGKLIYMTDVDISVSETDEEVTVTADAQRSFMKLKISQKALIVKPEKNIRRMN